jgi:hypothetical protein
MHNSTLYFEGHLLDLSFTQRGPTSWEREEIAQNVLKDYTDEYPIIKECKVVWYPNDDEEYEEEEETTESENIVSSFIPRSLIAFLGAVLLIIIMWMLDGYKPISFSIGVNDTTLTNVKKDVNQIKNELEVLKNQK